MKIYGIILTTLCLAGLPGCSSVSNQPASIHPVTPHAAPESVALLNYIQGISGQRTLTGQHNYPSTKDSSTQEAARIWGKTPAIFGMDFGFAARGDKDSAFVRQEIVNECKRQYALGSIVTLCWHAVPPTADEPVTFLPQPGTPTNRLHSVQGKLTNQQWEDLLTPGTELYQHWCAQVDGIAGYLKQLQDAHVPVLWRPYHEMNGDWFWWGGRSGPRGTTQLYRQLFERLVKVHKLHNLVWVWSVDRPSTPQRQFAVFYPGADYFDVAALDVYRSDFQQSYYDGLLKLADGKPIALAEVGPQPSLEVLEKQPLWTWWMTWPGFGSDKANAVHELVINPRSFSLGDAEYQLSITALRNASGLAPLRRQASK